MKGWRPSDFVVASQFCPTEEVHERLRALAEDVGCGAAVLLTFSGKELLRSLCFAVASDLHLETQFRDDLRKYEYERSKSSAPLSAALPENGGRLEADVVTRLGRQRCLRRIATRNRALRWRSFREGDIRKVSIVLLVSSDRTKIPRRSLHMPGLLTMISGTANLSTHRDELVMREMRKATTASRESRPASVVRDLLNASKAITDSDAVALYIVHPNPPALELKEATPKHPELSKPHSLIPIPSGGQRLSGYAPAAMRRRRPQLGMVVHKSASGSPWASTKGTSPRAEVAVPILAVPERDAGPCLAVLCLTRFGKNRHYGGWDLALLRNLSLRIGSALWVHREEETSEKLIKLSMGTGIYSERQEPEDLVAATVSDQRLADMLGSMADLTASSSATLRLLDAKVSDSGEPRLTLRRVLAVPDGNLLHEYDHIDLESTRSANAWAAREGLARNLPEISPTSKKFLVIKERPWVRSSISLPLIHANRILGTLNLESSVPRSYDHLQGRLASIALQVAHYIGAREQERLQEAIGLALRLVDVVHEIRKETRALTDFATEEFGSANKPMQKRICAQLLGNARRIDELLLVQMLAQHEPPSSALLALGDLLAEARDRARLSESLVVDGVSVRRLNEYLPTGDSSELLLVALTEALNNVARNKSISRPVITTAQEFKIGGEPSVLLSFTHRTKSLMSARTTDPYHQVATRFSTNNLEELRLGAFLAGSIMRLIGGDAYLRRESVRSAVTTLRIPVRHRQESQ